MTICKVYCSWLYSQMQNSKALQKMLFIEFKMIGQREGPLIAKKEQMIDIFNVQSLMNDWWSWECLENSFQMFLLEWYITLALEFINNDPISVLLSREALLVENGVHKEIKVKKLILCLLVEL